MEQNLLRLISDLKNEILEMKNQSNWMNVDETAKHLKISSSKVRQLVKDQTIPFSRLDPGNPKSKLLFNRKLIDAWLLTGKTKLTKKEKESIKEYLN